MVHMKVLITDKGEGFVAARFEAETNVEALILSVVAPTATRTGASIISPKRYGNEASVSLVHFDSFDVPAHEILDKR